MTNWKTTVMTKLCLLSILALVLPLYEAMALNSGKDGLLTLVKDGVPAATIIIDKNPTKAAAFAVEELNYHINKITGIKLPVKSTDIANDATGLKICVGESSETRKLGLKSSDFAPQEYLVLGKPGILVLMGKDDPTTGTMASPSALPDIFDNHATCSAVYDFLEKFCDVRWFGPGETGLCHPVSKTLAVNCEKVNIRRKPVFIWRFSSLIFSASKGVKDLFENPSPQDMKLFALRLRVGGEKYACSHSFYGYYDRFWAKNPKNEKDFEASHPEYFAKGYQGLPPQLCYTNEALMKQVIKDADDYFNEKNEHLVARGDYVSLEPMDTNEYCKCEKCQALMDKKTTELFNSSWGSRYWYNFVNKIASEVEKTHPGKFVSVLAYREHAYPPKDMKIGHNVSIQMCLATREWFIPKVKENELKLYHEWIEEGCGQRRMYLWLYYCFPADSGNCGGFNCFPGYFAHTMSEQIKMFAKDGIRGIFMEDFDIDVYLTYKLLDNPSLNIDDLLDDYFTKYYGAAAQPMKEIYLVIEDGYSNIKNYPEDIQSGKEGLHQTEEIAWKYLGTDERMKKLATLMNEAEKSAVTPADKKRVGLFKSGVWEKMVAGKTRYEYKEKYKDEVEKVKNTPPPEMSIPKMDKNAAGSLKAVDFSKAASFKWYTTYGYSPDRKITGKATYDDKYLYFELVDYIKPERLYCDGGIWNSDDWEIFFSTDRQSSYCNQLGINPAGKFLMLNSNAEYNSKTIVDSDTKQGDRWIVKVAIPLIDVLPGGVVKGSVFYMNIVRSTKSGGDNIAWSALFNNAFFTPARLGKITLKD